MKKLLLAVFTVLGLVIVDAQAFYRRCGVNNACSTKSSCAVSCAQPCEVRTCAQPCKVDHVVEQACPPVPCCVKYVRVEQPAEITKHISYTVGCPSDCTAENKAVGMMHAGETWQYNAADSDAK